MAIFWSMIKTDDRLKHGLHNEAACNYLELKKEFTDWIVTTAFYASLQFVSHRIFPFEMPSIEGKKTKIESLDDFARYQNNRRQTKHELLADLVGKQCSEISGDYDWLLSMSMNARYLAYQQDKQIADKARTLMKRIKQFCTKSPSR